MLGCKSLIDDDVKNGWCGTKTSLQTHADNADNVTGVKTCHQFD